MFAPVRDSTMNDVTRILSAIEPGDPRRPSSSCPWSTTSCASWRRSGWPRRSRGRRSRPPPWSTRPTCGWSAGRQPGGGTAAATSSPPRPRRCGGSSSTEPAASRAEQARRRRGPAEPEESQIAAPAASGRTGARRGARPAGRAEPVEARLVEAPLLRRDDHAEAGAALGSRERSCERLWTYARSFLAKEMALRTGDRSWAETRRILGGPRPGIRIGIRHPDPRPVVFLAEP